MKCLVIVLLAACMMLHSCLGATIPAKLESMNVAAQGGAVGGADHAWVEGPGKRVMRDADHAWIEGPGKRVMRDADHAWIEGPGKRAKRDADHAWVEGPGKAVDAVAKRAAGISAKVGGRRRRATAPAPTSG